jgi:hypothetical protein
MNGGPGYVFSQTVSSSQGGWQGYTANGTIIESHLDNTGIPSGPPGGSCSMNTEGVTVCQLEF